MFYSFARPNPCSKGSCLCSSTWWTTHEQYWLKRRCFVISDTTTQQEKAENSETNLLFVCAHSTFVVLWLMLLYTDFIYSIPSAKKTKNVEAPAQPSSGGDEANNIPSSSSAPPAMSSAESHRLRRERLNIGVCNGIELSPDLHQFIAIYDAYGVKANFDIVFEHRQKQMPNGTGGRCCESLFIISNNSPRDEAISPPMTPELLNSLSPC